jgi:hypothetical protein
VAFGYHNQFAAFDVLALRQTGGMSSPFSRNGTVIALVVFNYTPTGGMT